MYPTMTDKTAVLRHALLNPNPEPSDASHQLALRLLNRGFQLRLISLLSEITQEMTAAHLLGEWTQATDKVFMATLRRRMEEEGLMKWVANEGNSQLFKEAMEEFFGRPI